MFSTCPAVSNVCKFGMLLPESSEVSTSPSKGEIPHTTRCKVLRLPSRLACNTLGSQLRSFPNLCRSNASILLLGIFNLGVPWSAVRHFCRTLHLGSKWVSRGSTVNRRENRGNEETDTVETEIRKKQQRSLKTWRVYSTKRSRDAQRWNFKNPAPTPLHCLVCKGRLYKKNPSFCCFRVASLTSIKAFWVLGM